MGFLQLFKPRPVLPRPQLRLLVFATEETLPWPIQIIHPDRLWGALPGIPIALRQHPDPRMLLEQPMVCGNYLLKGLHGDVQACVESRHPGASYPDRGKPCPSGSPMHLGTVERDRLECSRWLVTLEMAEAGAEVGSAVLYQMELADRLARLSEGAILDPTTHRCYLPGGWRIAGALKPLDAREHVVLHVKAGESRSLWVHTHGLCKFGRPELEILGLPETLGEPACRLMMDLCQQLVAGGVLKPGNLVGNQDSPLLLRPGRRESEDHFSAPSLELVDVDRGGKPVERGAARGVEAYWRASAAAAR